MERLNAEAAARAKRERRRANELKARTIQRMQLQMTAPMDIGMEQQDAALGLGQDDVFDLTQARQTQRKDQNAAYTLDGEGDDAMVDSEAEDDQAEAEDEPLDSEEEKERKLTGLEAELDGLYDAYQGRLRERDAKYKVKEARRNNAEREEWGGINDHDDQEDSDSEEGGWDKVQESKVNDDDSSSSDSSDDSDAEAPPVSRILKRRRSGQEQLLDQEKKRQRLVPSAESAKSKVSTSAAAQVWFSQGIFSEINGLDKFSESDSSEGSIDEEASESEEEDQVRRLKSSFTVY